jgi:hypothetical protein
VLDLSDTIAAEEEQQFLEAVAWNEILTHPRYEQTIGRRIKELLAEANIVVLDWRRDPRERDVATGKVELACEVQSWTDQYAAIVEMYRRRNAEDAEQQQEEQKREETASHPERGEAWYEKTD